MPISAWHALTVNAPYSADPCVAARHVTGKLPDLSHIWRTGIADLLADHMSLSPFDPFVLIKGSREHPEALG